ncbi:MAG: phage integrase SAM-like domain-containing protein [Bacteroidota bacterium]|nr:phage integrase SAM-like domain-containing protein [Bacteroidota bacterium]
MKTVASVRKVPAAKNKKEALLVLSDFKNFTKEKQKPVFFTRYSEQYFTVHSNTLRPQTLRSYKQSLSNFVRLVGDIILNRLTPKHWDQFKSRRSKECSPITANIELRSLKAIMSTAVRWKLDRNTADKEASFYN